VSGENETPKVVLKIDLSAANKIAEIGIRRAAAFLKISQKLEWNAVPEHLALDGGIDYGFFPQFIDEEARKNIHAEYQAWVLGAALKEIDQHFSLFLDAVWNNLELSDWHGKKVHSSELVPNDERFASDTNSARKLEKIATRIGSDFSSKHIDSLSRARNLLTHGIGQVRRRDLNVDGALAITWLGLDLIADDGDQKIIVNDHPLNTHPLHLPHGAELTLKFTERTKLISLGHLLRFSERELAEICFYYQSVIDKLLKDTSGYLLAKFGKANPAAEA